MTRDQIIAKWNALEPRKRDAWVAIVVFGWFDCDIVPRGGYGRMILVPPIDDERRGWATTYDEYGFPHWLPHYTEDIDAAWAVVNETAKWGGMDIGCYGKPGAQFYVAATHTDTAPYQRMVSVTRSSAPEAICLAAIIAKLAPAV